MYITFDNDSVFHKCYERKYTFSFALPFSNKCVNNV